MFVASIEINHPFNNPLVFNLVVQVASKYPMEERCWILIEYCTVSIFYCSFDILEYNERLDLPHYHFELLEMAHQTLHEKDILFRCAYLYYLVIVYEFSLLVLTFDYDEVFSLYSLVYTIPAYDKAGLLFWFIAIKVRHLKILLCLYMISSTDDAIFLGLWFLSDNAESFLLSDCFKFGIVYVSDLDWQFKDIAFESCFDYKFANIVWRQLLQPIFDRIQI